MIDLRSTKRSWPHGRGRPEHRGRSALGWACVVAIATGVFALEPGSAAPVALTANSGNSVSTATVDPPTDVTTSMQLNLSPLGLPLLTCKVTVSWTASVSPEVDGYEVRRMVNSVPTAGPWSIAGSPFTDPEVPLATAATVASWQVRSKLAGTSWRSEWATATDADLLPCLLPLEPLGAAPDSGSADADTTEADGVDAPATTEPNAPVDDDGVDVPVSTLDDPVDTLDDPVDTLDDPGNDAGSGGADPALVDVVPESTIGPVTSDNSDD